MSPSSKTSTAKKNSDEIPDPAYLEVGKKATAFTAMDQDGNSISLSGFGGGWGIRLNTTWGSVYNISVIKVWSPL